MDKPLISALIVVLPLLVSAAAAAEENDCFGFAAAFNSATALEYKIIAIFATLIVGVFGVCFAIFGFHVDGLFFFLVKPFGSGVISVACALYILPDAKKSLTSSCIGDFPMSTAVVAMSAAILTMIESKSFMNRRNQNGDQTHDGSVSHNKIRPNLLTQVLKLGIVDHSVIIGISLGASQNVGTIKPLAAAITFHQLFEGVARGGCISQAKFELKKSLMMAIVFGLTTPVGIGIGIGVAEIYGPTTLMVSGFLKAAAAGILLYKAGVTLYGIEALSRFDMLIACFFVLRLLPF